MTASLVLFSVFSVKSPTLCNNASTDYLALKGIWDTYGKTNIKFNIHKGYAMTEILSHNQRLSRVIVTGGMGFIGSAMIRHLVHSFGSSILNIDKLTYAGDLETVSSVSDTALHKHIKLDICDNGAIREAIHDFRPSAIIHIAAETHVDRSIDDSSIFIKTNICGTHSMLQATLSYWQTLDKKSQEEFRFLHVSTDEVFGSLNLNDTVRFNETYAYAPNSPYSASKASSDHLVRAWGKTYSLPTLTTHCSNNYGPFQFPEKLIPLLIINAMHGQALPIYGEGKNIRDWLHVDDHISALIRIVEQGQAGDVYCIGGNAERQNIEVAQTVCAALDAALPNSPHYPHAKLIQFVPDRPGHDQKYAIDDSKLRKKLKWSPMQDFECGIRNTVSWYIAHQEWWKRIRKDRYDGSRLGRL